MLSLLNILNEIDMIVFQFQAGEPSRCVSPGVDIDTVGTNFRLGHGGVSVDDDLAEFLFAKEKILTNP